MPVGYSIYKDRGSILHTGIDPRTKYAGLAALFIFALCSNNPFILGGGVLFLVLCMLWARLRWKDVATFVYLAIWLSFLSVVIWPAYIPQGTVLLHVWNIPITTDGIGFGLAMGMRITIMILAASVLMLTTSPQLFTAGFLAMGMNYRAGMALALTMRFIPLMNSERITILEAQRARGADYARGNLFMRMVRTAPVLIPLFGRAMMTAQNLTVAMDARGFGVGHKRTSIIQLHFRTLDKVMLIAFLALVVASIVLRVLGIGLLVKGML